jgi:hypothetical protein
MVDFAKAIDSLPPESGEEAGNKEKEQIGGGGTLRYQNTEPDRDDLTIFIYHHTISLPLSYLFLYTLYRNILVHSCTINEIIP